MPRRVKLQSRITWNEAKRTFANTSDEDLADLTTTVFGFFFKMTNITWVGNIFASVIEGMMACEGDKVDFVIGGKEARFTPYDLTLLLGLRSDGKVKASKFREPTSFRNRYFKDFGARIPMDEVAEAMEKVDVDNVDDFRRLASLYVLGSFLLVNSVQNIDAYYVDLADDFQKFCEQPWAHIVFENMAGGFTKAADAIKKSRSSTRTANTKTYNVHGCPYALLVWVYERFPAFRLSDPQDMDQSFPRILRWTSDKYMGESRAEKISMNKSLECVALVATDEESSIPLVQASVVAYEIWCEKGQKKMEMKVLGPKVKRLKLENKALAKENEELKMENVQLKLRLEVLEKRLQNVEHATNIGQNVDDDEEDDSGGDDKEDDDMDTQGNHEEEDSRVDVTDNVEDGMNLGKGDDDNTPADGLDTEDNVQDGKNLDKSVEENIPSTAVDGKTVDEPEVSKSPSRKRKAPVKTVYSRRYKLRSGK